MVTEVGSTIQVYEPSEELVRWCKDHLTLPNPEYYKKERMGLWTGKTPETISLWRMGSTTPSHLPVLEMPFGVFREVQHLLDNVQVLFRDNDHVDYGTPIPLYDYQQDAVDAIYNKRYGIAVLNVFNLPENDLYIIQQVLHFPEHPKRYSQHGPVGGFSPTHLP